MLFEHLIVHIHFILDLILNIAEALMNRTILKSALYKYFYLSNDPCVQKLDCQICQAFMPAQVKQLSTPTFQSRKECELKKTATDSPASATPTLLDPSEVTLLGRVHKESASESTSASKTKKTDHSVGGTGSSLVQATGEAVVSEAASKSATLPVEGPGTDVSQQNATQPVEAPGAGMATQP